MDVRLSGGWASGPLDPQGTAIALSERPLMCGAANWTDQEAVIGGSDHALYVLCLQKGIKKRSLFNKTYGHSEWVTACTYMDDGRIVSRRHFLRTLPSFPSSALNNVQNNERIVRMFS